MFELPSTAGRAQSWPATQNIMACKKCGKPALSKLCSLCKWGNEPLDLHKLAEELPSLKRALAEPKQPVRIIEKEKKQQEAKRKKGIRKAPKVVKPPKPKAERQIFYCDECGGERSKWAKSLCLACDKAKRAAKAAERRVRLQVEKAAKAGARQAGQQEASPKLKAIKFLEAGPASWDTLKRFLRFDDDRLSGLIANLWNDDLIETCGERVYRLKKRGQRAA